MSRELISWPGIDSADAISNTAIPSDVLQFFQHSVCADSQDLRHIAASFIPYASAH